MTKLSKNEISSTYALIKEYHEKYLKKHGVKLPKLSSGDSYTKDALTLVYLAQGYPDTRIVTKAKLTEFIREYDNAVTDVQQARHLAAQKGWFILSGTRNDNISGTLGPGEYQLKTMEKPYPGFTAERRGETIDENFWESLKKQYDYRCACCGSEEGKPHRYWKNTITVLQKGHRDPNKALTPDNIIPQCEKCNRPDRNYWVYDNKGRVIEIANAEVIDRCSKQVKKEIYTRLYRFFHEKAPDKI